jgi:CheY-like chemotaxis protein
MRTALVLEDDEFSMRVFDQVLRRKGLLTVPAHSGAEALTVARKRGWRFDLIVCDVRLPDATRTRVAVELSAAQPGVPILFSSGTPLEGWTVQELSDLALLPSGMFSFLPKPFRAQDLISKVDELLEGSNAGWRPPNSPARQPYVAA